MNGDVLAGLHHMSAGIPADGPRSDDRDFPAHGFPRHFLRRRTQARVRSSVAAVTLTDRR